MVVISAPRGGRGNPAGGRPALSAVSGCAAPDRQGADPQPSAARAARRAV